MKNKFYKVIALIMAGMISLSSVSVSALAEEENIYEAESDEKILVEDALEDEKLEEQNKDMEEPIKDVDLVQELIDESREMESSVKNMGGGSGDVLASGKSNNIVWSITGDGELIITGSGNLKDSMDRPWFDYSDNIVSARISAKNVTDLGFWFCGLTELKEVDFSGFNTSSVKYMNNMFTGCNSLETLDLSGFDTRNVIAMQYMFSDCTSLKSLNLSSFNTAKVTSMSGMFWQCMSLEEADLQSFEFTNVKDMSFMFFYCSELQRVKIKSSKAAYVTSLADMFDGCDSIEAIDLSPLQIKSVTDMGSMFSNCSALKSVNLSSFDTSNVTDMSYLFRYCTNLESVNLSSFNTSKVEDVSHMFERCGKLSILDLSSFDLSKMFDAEDMLDDCNMLEKFITPHKIGSSYILLPQEMYDEEGESYEKIGNFNRSKVLTLDDSIKTGLMKTGGTIKSQFSEEYFDNTSKVYNHELARFAIAMDTMCYSKKDSMKSFLKKNGFQGELDQYDYDTDVYTGFETAKEWIGYQYLNENEVLIGVFIRGTSGSEWIDNFEPGRDSVHQGFKQGSDKVYKDLEEFIEKHDFSGKKIKLLITGHSRGAAVANLLGARIDDGDYRALGIDDVDDVYVYTFATPNVAKIPKESMVVNDYREKKYWNIYNIVNPEDFVTKVLPSKWGYGRYGFTYVLPSKTTDAGSYAGEYLNSMRAFFSEATGGTRYEPYIGGMVPVSKYVNSVCKGVSSIEEYYDLNLIENNWLYKTLIGNIERNTEFSLRNLFKKILGYSQCGIPVYKNVMEEEAFNAIVGGKYSQLGRQTIKFFCVYQIVGGSLKTLDFQPYFEFAHQPEMYYAAMMSISRDELTRDRDVLYGIVNCPVDVVISDKDGNILGRIESDEVIEKADTIELEVEGDSKSFYLPGNGDFNVELSGNNKGKLDYSIARIDPDTGETERVYYNDLDVSTELSKAGSKYTQDLSSGTPIASCELVNARNGVEEPTAVISAENLGGLSVSVDIQGEGNADMYTSLTPGDYVELHAYEADSSVFQGWFEPEGGELICEDNPYCFSISDDVNLVAKFEKVPSGLRVDLLEGDTYIYNGKAIAPEVRVYDGKKELEKGTHYTVSYKNNTKAYSLKEEDEGFDYAKAPTVTITGKGNYSGKIVKTFVIDALDVSLCQVDDILLQSTGKIQKTTKPVVSYNLNGKNIKLKEKTDYLVEFSDSSAGAYVNPGIYEITITGIGNYKGTRVIHEKITNLELISKLSYTIKNGTCLKDDYNPGDYVYPSSVIVKNGSAILKGRLLLGHTKEEAEAQYEDKLESMIADGYHFAYYCTDNNAAGNGNITFVGIASNGYEGTITKTFKIEGLAASKITVTGLKSSYQWIPEGIDPFHDGTVTLKCDGLPVVEGVDYELVYSGDVKKQGKVQVTIKGLNKFTGTVNKTYTVTGAPISKCVAEGVQSSYVYTGGEISPRDTLRVVYREKNKEDVVLEEGADYELKVTSNVNVGTAKVEILGINNYSGKIQKTFRIVAKTGIYIDPIPSQTYTKGGVEPSIRVYDAPADDANRCQLVAGKDYKVTYANNKKVFADVRLDSKTTPAPKVTVTGIGNHSGSGTALFAITESSLKSIKSATATNVTYQPKANLYKIKPVLKDVNDQLLKEKTDYIITGYKYAENTTVQNLVKVGSVSQLKDVYRNEGDDIDDLDIIPYGSRMKILIEGCGMYEGQDGHDSFIEIPYRVDKGDISKANVKISAQKFTGNPIVPSEEDIIVTINNITLDGVLDDGNYVDDFDVAYCTNNTNKGTAKAVLVGKGNYSGTKTVTFTITSRSMNYTIHYDKNAEDATGTMKDSLTATGTKLTSNSFKRNGYAFAGWNTSASGTGKTYNNQETFRIKAVNQVFGTKETLYAQWAPVNYSIKYNLNGGMQNESNPASYTILEEVLLEEPTREGYTFAGWYFDGTFKNPASIPVGSTGNKIIYAKWIRN